MFCHQFVRIHFSKLRTFYCAFEISNWVRYTEENHRVLLSLHTHSSYQNYVPYKIFTSARFLAQTLLLPVQLRISQHIQHIQCSTKLFFLSEAIKDHRFRFHWTRPNVVQASVSFNMAPIIFSYLSFVNLSSSSYASYFMRTLIGVDAFGINRCAIAAIRCTRFSNVIDKARLESIWTWLSPIAFSVTVDSWKFTLTTLFAHHIHPFHLSTNMFSFYFQRIFFFSFFLFYLLLRWMFPPGKNEFHSESIIIPRKITKLGTKKTKQNKIIKKTHAHPIEPKNTEKNCNILVDSLLSPGELFRFDQYAWTIGIAFAFRFLG